MPQTQKQPLQKTSDEMLSQLLTNPMRIAFISLLLAALAACATTQTVTGSAVPAGRQFAAPKPAGKEAGAIIVTRDSGLLGAGCFMALYMNGQLVARIGSGEFVSLPTDPGEVLLKVGRDPDGAGLCSASLDGLTEQIETTIKPSQVKHFRISGGMDRGFFVQRSD